MIFPLLPHGRMICSQRKADARAHSSGAPRETMQQHLATFLAHKFGLKKLSAEWHQGLQAALAAFEPADAHVKLFRKVRPGVPSRSARPSLGN